MLAALEFLGVEGADRLEDRAGTLVALFGTSATKRVGAAANAAVAEQRWAALQLASAASDLVGPEQVEQLLALSAPDGVDPFPRGAACGSASSESAIAITSTGRSAALDLGDRCRSVSGRRGSPAAMFVVDRAGVRAAGGRGSLNHPARASTKLGDNPVW